MFTVALVGADGAGKTTVGRALERTLPFPAVYLYMGVNLEASSTLLPTTRLIRLLRRVRRVPAGPTAPPGHGCDHTRSASAARRAAAALKGSVRLTYLLLEESYRLAVSSYHRRRGRVVIFDRHFFADYYATDVKADRQRPLLRRLHGRVLSRYPKPDLTICLDAPAEVLWSRKPEGRIEWVAQRRAEYLQLRSVAQRFVLIDAARPPETVTRDVAAVIAEHRAERSAATS